MTDLALPPDELLTQAIAQHQGGQSALAQATCHAILASVPDHAGALHLQAVIDLSHGRAEAALAGLDRAIAAEPGNAMLHAARAQALKSLARLDEAIASHREAIRLQPGIAGLHYNEGNTLLEAGRLDEAAERFERAIALQPAWADAHNNLGNVRRRQGRFEDAVAAFRKATAFSPAAELRFNLAETLAEQGRHDGALPAYVDTLRAAPGHTLARFGLAKSLVALGRLETAAACWQSAVHADPSDHGARTEYATALVRIGRFAEAEQQERAVLALRPDWAGAHNNLANVLEMRGNIAEAITHYERALALEPEFAVAHCGFSTALCRAGRFPEAWAHYEARWQANNRTPRFSAPPWNGESLGPDDTLLLHWEQGLGDSAFFARFIPLAARRGRVVVLVQPPLRRLFAGLPGVAAVFDDDNNPPAHTAHCPLGSLPRALGVTRDAIAPDVPYLHPAPEAAARWQRRLATLPGLHVGLVWAGNPKYEADYLRSLSPAALAPLAGIPGISFVSLQKGAPSPPPPDVLACDWTGELTDFADTAALMAALDLVLTVDTSSAHIAGAIGAPVWLMNRLNADWRWTPEGGAAEWYPTVRQFRQSREGGWGDVVDAVRQALMKAGKKGLLF